jgi:hypothetical protein
MRAASEHEFISNCRSLILAIKELRTVLGADDDWHR